MPLLFLIAYPLFAWYLFKTTKNQVKNIPWNIKFLGIMGFVFLYLFTLYNNIIQNDFIRWEWEEIYFYTLLIICITYIFTFFIYKSKYKDILENDVDFYLNQQYISKKEFIINFIFFLIPIWISLFWFFKIWDKIFQAIFMDQISLVEILYVYLIFYFFIASIYWFFATIEKYTQQGIIKKIKKEIGFEEKVREKLEEKK